MGRAELFTPLIVDRERLVNLSEKPQRCEKYLSRETLSNAISAEDVIHVAHLSTDLVTPLSGIIYDLCL